jgi:nicotinamide-nucleotide amidase
VAADGVRAEEAPTVAFVACGDELTAGRRADANGQHLARAVAEAGGTLVGARIVGDDGAAIARAVEDAAATASLVVVSGGLGPTADDRTRDALALVTGRPLVEDADAIDAVQAALDRRGRPWHPAQARQAMVPEGASVLANARGTAPGFAVRAGGAEVLCLPGVPVEFRAMVREHVLPRLRESGGTPPAVRTVWVCGCAEAEIAGRLGGISMPPGVMLGSYPRQGQVALRITASGPRGAAHAARVEEDIRRRLGPDALDGGPVAAHVIERLTRERRTLAVAESVTGGRIAAALTAVSGAGEVLRGAWVAYSLPFKTAALGVSPETLERDGAVSEATAREMADGARARAGADCAVATTGVAGPGPMPQGGRKIPAGTVLVGVATDARATEVVRLLLAGLPRREIQRRAATFALDALRRRLDRR